MISMLALGPAGIWPGGPVQASGSSPTAVADYYHINMGETLDVAAPGVLGNDTDPENDPLTSAVNEDWPPWAYQVTRSVG